MKVIALEEHYYDAELASLSGFAASPAMRHSLLAFETQGMEEMDRAGIDVQVLSHNAPSGQAVGACQADCDMVRRVNDRLAAMCARHPGRLYAFAALPTANPEAAARELDRCVTELGFVGAMIHGPTGGRFIDERFFWPIFERAEALDVPIYLHPSYPLRQLTDLYCADYAKRFPQFPNAGWGFTVETASIAIRLILSGVFDRHPRLRCVLGHFGETLPFHLWRLNNTLSIPGPGGLDFRAAFRRHFWLTCSGLFSTPALQCAAQELGLDHLMFSIDWPYERCDVAAQWARALPLAPEDLRGFLAGNAERLLRI